MGLYFSRVKLENWRNFKTANVALSRRVFMVGPNAVGKSNLLNVFRFLRDLVTEGGGLVQACKSRDGVGKIRSVFARNNPVISIEVDVADAASGRQCWKYEIAFTHAGGSDDTPVIRRERVMRYEDGEEVELPLLRRPDVDDQGDPQRLRQTAIQQLSENKEFRELAEFFRSVQYLHLVPQLVREGQDPIPGTIGSDPYGRDLLERIRNTPRRTQQARLRRIEEAVKLAVEPLERLELVMDERGRPHLQAVFKHWRPRGAYQDERQFSDGTLRLIGLLWSLQEKGGPLLLEEPELSLHAAFVARLAPFIARAQRKSGGRQVLISTHSADLLADEAIGSDEVVLVRPAQEGAEAITGFDVQEVRELMEAGLTAAEVALPRTKPMQADLFDRADIA